MWPTWTSTRTSSQAPISEDPGTRQEHDGPEHGPERRCVRVRYTGSGNFPTSAAPDARYRPRTTGRRQGLPEAGKRLASLEFSTYYGGSQDDYDPVGERGIKFSNCRIYTSSLRNPTTSH